MKILMLTQAKEEVQGSIKRNIVCVAGDRGWMVELNKCRTFSWKTAANFQSVTGSQSLTN